MKKLAATVVLLGALGGGGFWYYRYSKRPTPPAVTTAPVTRGDILETVGATGTLQAVTTVQVGSQVSGNIAYLGADYNSIVRKGQVLARLDPSLFEAQAQQSRANLAQARANLNKAQSDLDRNRVQLVDAQQKYTRARELATRNLLPQSDLDTAKTAVDTAEAGVKSQQATVAQVQAAITQAEAAVNQSQVNLEHTVITAPIDGLVISRNVDVGQTVASSLQAPTLFVLAADLTKMQVVASLDESDVGRIRPNQLVTFRVDAYPSETFRGTVTQVRLEPKVQQNVVTYSTVIDVPNNDLRLKPGMTANVNVEISHATNVLRVPNAALRFRPSNDVFAALGQTPPEPQGRGGFPGGRRGGSENGQPGSPSSPSSGQEGSTGSQRPPAPSQPSGMNGRRPGSDAPTQRQETGRGEVPALTPNGEGSGARGVAGGAEPSDGSAGAGGSGGRGGFARGGTNAGAGGANTDQDDARRNRFAERMQNLSPEEREAMLARMRARGFDPGASGGDFSGRGGAPAAGGAGGSGRGGQQTAENQPPRSGRRASIQTPTAGAAAKESGPTTIDALFAPLPRTETVGRAWIYTGSQLRPIRLRLGISDGQNTELIEGDLKEGAEVVTNVTIAGQTTRPATTAFPGFGPGGRGGFGGGRGAGFGR